MRTHFFRTHGGQLAEFLSEGPDYYERYLNLIREARKSIHLQTFIFEADAFGKNVQAELIKAAERGVQVYVLADSMGSITFPGAEGDRLVLGGVHFCRFNGFRFKWLGQWGRRLHHKVLLIDHERALVGGINVISSSYGTELEPQKDFAIFIEGQICSDLAEYCQFVFKKACAKKTVFEKIKRVKPGLAASLQRIEKKLEQGHELRISINDWVYRRWQITRQYSRRTQTAQNSILIVNSYFFPRRKFMRQLAKAARRGVRVRLVLPKLSDWPSYVKASRYLYSYFLKNGIEIYEWEKSILHGKLAVVDGRWCTIGSFNLNYTSYQQNLEMNVDVDSPAFAATVGAEIEKMIASGCEKINAAEFIEKATYRERFSRFFYYVILALVANFSIGLVFQEQKKRSRTYQALRVAASLLLFILGLIGAVLPVMPGIPFFIASFLLIYRQILFNNKDV